MGQLVKPFVPARMNAMGSYTTRYHFPGVQWFWYLQQLQVTAKEYFVTSNNSYDS